MGLVPVVSVLAAGPELPRKAMGLYQSESVTDPRVMETGGGGRDALERGGGGRDALERGGGGAPPTPPVRPAYTQPLSP